LAKGVDPLFGGLRAIFFFCKIEGDCQADRGGEDTVTGCICQAEDACVVGKAGVFLVEHGDKDVGVCKELHFFDLFEAKNSSLLSLRDLFFVWYSTGPSATWRTQSEMG